MSNSSQYSLSPVLPLTNFGNVLMFLFSISLASAIVFLNVSVSFSILMNRVLRSENRFMYMLSTCFSDVCSGVSYYYVGVLDVQDHFESPNRTYYIAPTFLGLSFMAVLAAQADRYHAVMSPFRYSQRMTRNRTVVVIFAYWVYAFFIVGVHNLVTVGIAKKLTAIGAFVGNVFLVLIMLGLNIKLYLIAKFHLQREQHCAESESKRASVLLVLVVAGFFLGTWLPIIIHISVCHFLNMTCYAFKNEGTDPLRILPRVNAVLTPLLYIRGSAPLRATLLTKVWRRCCITRRLTPAGRRPGSIRHPSCVT